jgi:hypothetical protein
MNYIGCTRFTNETYEENSTYKNNNGETVMYGLALKIRGIYPIGAHMFIAEMNNNKNKIEGIGLIINQMVTNKRHKIYSDNNYNRYIYRGKYWMSRDEIAAIDASILEILDTILFKGKSHLKNRMGISILSDQIFTHWDYTLRDLKHKINLAFSTHFTHLDIDQEVNLLHTCNNIFC